MGKQRSSVILESEVPGNEPTIQENMSVTPITPSLSFGKYFSSEIG